jgi:hypothetical protein
VIIERFRALETAHELRASITLRDGSVVHVHDYLLRDGTRKYAYHWQTRHGRLRRRWDNSGHWPEVPSHPHHVHVGRATNVSASRVRDLTGAMNFIAKALRQQAHGQLPPPARRRTPRGRRR